jgi:hypothetical protein
MLWSLTMLLVSFISLLTLSIPDSDLWQAKFLHIVLMIVVLSNVGVSVMQVKTSTKVNNKMFLSW